MSRDELISKINEICGNEGVWSIIDDNLAFCRYDRELEIVVYKDKVIVPDFHRLNDCPSVDFETYIEYIKGLNGEV